MTTPTMLPALDEVTLAPAPAPAPKPDRPRPFVVRLACGFVLVYLTLYNLPFPLDRLAQSDALPWLARIPEAYDHGVRAATEWFGAKVLGRTDVQPIERTGSGDTLFDYVRAATLAIAALVLALGWAAADRRGAGQAHAQALVRVYVRYALAATMLSYGFAKVLPMQFGVLDEERLYGTYGNASPMNLVWTFLAASPAYTIFAGAMEVLGGMLLFFRRTTALGALVTGSVLLNVAMINFCYDVPVKLYSTHLLLMAAFLLAADTGRLLHVLLLNRATEPAVLRRPLPRWSSLVLLVLKLAFVGYLVWTMSASNWQRWQERNTIRLPALQGIWEVREFASGLPPVAAPPPERAWQRIVFSRYGFATIVRRDGSKEYWRAKVDADEKRVTLTPPPDAGGKQPLALAYEESSAHAAGGSPVRQLCLTGEVDGRTLRVVTQLRDPDSFLIRSRGFHWVQSYPFNRNQ